MSITKKEYDEAEFKGIIYTLMCDTTGNKMLDILARDEDVENAPVTSVDVKWVPTHLGSGSGKHSLSGLLSYGPVDSHGQKTEILDMNAEENEEGEMQIKVYVSPVFEQEQEGVEDE
jgi:hypothetical protein